MMGSGNVKLNVELNEWYCECDFRFFELLESYNADLMDEIICDNPQEYFELDLKQLHTICQDIETTALTTKVSSSTSATTPNVTVPTTTTSVSATVSTLDPTSISQTTITSWETSATTTTLETSSTTTTLKPSPTVSPPYMNSTTTTPAPEHTTTTSQPIITEKVAITCYKDIQKTDAFKTDIQKETLNFTIHTTSTTSVRIEVPFSEPREALTVLYFINYNDYQSINVYARSKEAVHIAITNLLAFKVYLFCVIKDSSTAISPYDCQAHYLANIQQKAWLLQHDKAWFLAISILSALIVLVCSAVVAYYILRRHPYWLKKCNEVKHVKGHNRPSLSIPPASARSSNYLQPSVVKADISAERRLYITKHSVPLGLAPRSPLTSREMASKTTLPPRNACLHGCKVNCLCRISETFYQAFDHHYEEVNF